MHVTPISPLPALRHGYNWLARPHRATFLAKPHKKSSPGTAESDRREGLERRRRILHALFFGSFRPRRREFRRAGERGLGDLDWHHPWWLAVAMLIVLMSCVDAFLTLTLLQNGAYEVNPIMDSLIGGSALAFAVVKVGLTAGGVVLLTLLARMRAFGAVPVSLILYLVLIGYGVLIAYELRLLEETLRTV